MKTYGIGSHRINVYEPRDARPPGAVMAVARQSLTDFTTCFVDRVFGANGRMDSEAMTEALTRHGRLKMGISGLFELRLFEPPPEALDERPDRLVQWAASHWRGLFPSRGDARPHPARFADD